MGTDLQIDFPEPRNFTMKKDDHKGTRDRTIEGHIAPGKLLTREKITIQIGKRKTKTSKVMGQHW